MCDCESGIPAAALQIVRLEYDNAVTKHPEFPNGQGAISIIAEELGELAKEVNDNLPEMCEFYHNNPRKIFANVYIDDHNAGGLVFAGPVAKQSSGR